MVKLAEKHIQQTTLSNGITLIVIPNPTTEIIAGRIFCRHAGSLWESPSQAGIFNLLASVMGKGTEKRTSLDIAEIVESKGAGLSVNTSTDYFLVSVKTVTDDFADIFSLAGEILRYPSFPASEVNLEKKITLQNILSQQEQPLSVAFNQLKEMLYGAHHPYGYSLLGTTETVNNLTVDDLKLCHQQYIRPDHLVISIAGNIELERATVLVNEVFGDWEKPRENPAPSTVTIPTPQAKYQQIHQSNQQTMMMLGYLAPEMSSAHYATLKLLSTYLGNGLSSRLFVELREKRGLAYDVSAFYPTRIATSQFVLYMGSAPENLEIGLTGLKNEVQRLREIPLTPEELQNSKNKLLGQYALGKQTNGELAQTLGWYQTVGLGVEYDQNFPEAIKNVTSDDIQQVACAYLNDSRLCVSIVS